MPEIGNGQRAFWSFLLVSLAAPMVVAVLVLVAAVAGHVAFAGAPPLPILEGAISAPLLARLAIRSYILSALPCAVGAAALAALVTLRGRSGWLEPAVIGGIVATIAAVVTGLAGPATTTPIAALGALTGIASWMILCRARIIPAGPAA
jgi:hypothetical protein